MILHQGRFIGSFDLEETSDLSNVNIMIGRVRDFLKDFKELRKQDIILTSDKYMYNTSEIRPIQENMKSE